MTNKRVEGLRLGGKSNEKNKTNDNDESLVKNDTKSSPWLRSNARNKTTIKSTMKLQDKIFGKAKLEDKESDLLKPAKVAESPLKTDKASKRLEATPRDMLNPDNDSFLFKSDRTNKDTKLKKSPILKQRKTKRTDSEDIRRIKTKANLEISSPLKKKRVDDVLLIGEEEVKEEDPVEVKSKKNDYASEDYDSKVSEGNTGRLPRESSLFLSKTSLERLSKHSLGFSSSHRK